MDRPLASGRQPCFASRSFSPLRAVCCTGPTRSRQRPTRSSAPNFAPNADVVAACTRIIEATNSSTLDRAVSHTFRADAARADGNTAAAIADYNQALALMPTLVPALSGRGIAYRNAQKYDLSLHDFDQAIAIEPNNAR